MTPSVVVHLDGGFVSLDEAKVPLTDRGYLLGEGVFATMRAYRGACFRSAEHLAILERGAAQLGLALPMPTADIARLADETAQRFASVGGDRDGGAMVRVTLARCTESESTGRLSVLARPLSLPSASDYEHGVVATVVAARRIPSVCLDPTPKFTSYVPQVLARREAETRRAAEGLQLAIDGSVACGAFSNVFVVRGDELLTPHRESGCREGVTRRAVLELAASLGLVAKEASLALVDLFDADEVFLTNVRIECLPVASIDDRSIGVRRRTHGADVGLRFPKTFALRSALHALALRSAG